VSRTRTRVLSPMNYLCGAGVHVIAAFGFLAPAFEVCGHIILRASSGISCLRVRQRLGVLLFSLYPVMCGALMFVAGAGGRSGG
jgi:hypothetical protein